MIIYSKNIVRFITEIKSTIKTILKHDFTRKVTTDRFYDEQQKISYPINAVIYNNKSMLGYFCPDFYELGFHEQLMHASKEKLGYVIKHELAHYLLWIKFGQTVQPHGTVFRDFCKRMGWPQEVYSATLSLQSDETQAQLEESAIVRKVKKLMALATSHNHHEAELAMIKSQQLLLTHNIESTYIDNEDGQQVCLKRILKQKREDAKMRTIARILQTFFVSCVFSRSKEHTYLEILGSKENVAVAEYVAAFLQLELDTLWHQAQKYSHLRGQIAKQSFLLAIARGYCDKIDALKRGYDSDATTALMVIENKLIEAKAMAYKRLTTTKSSGRYCKASSNLGEQIGKTLTINPALNSSKNQSGGVQLLM